MVEEHCNTTINTQTNAINNSPTMRAKCGWWEREEGTEELNIQCVGPDTKWSQMNKALFQDKVLNN